MHAWAVSVWDIHCHLSRLWEQSGRCQVIQVPARGHLQCCLRRAQSGGCVLRATPSSYLGSLCPKTCARVENRAVCSLLGPKKIASTCSRSSLSTETWPRSSFCLPKLRVCSVMTMEGHGISQRPWCHSVPLFQATSEITGQWAGAPFRRARACRVVAAPSV